MTPHEQLARAMCSALGLDPDEKIPGRPYPPHSRAFPDPSQGYLLERYSSQWTWFLWDAEQFLFERSGGRIVPDRKK